ncbi:TPA: alpha-1,2-fucosyltransferase, partial [Escherichia coli]|nr:alpha-1,2-fucosyltransferase [Escherichia coli]
MTFIVRLTGGLGNQMFQYALARSLAKKYNARLKLDISYYHNQPHKDTPRTFELNQLCIVDNILNSSSFSEKFLYIYDKLRVKLSKKISLPYFRNIVTPVNFN